MNNIQGLEHWEDVISQTFSPMSFDSPKHIHEKSFKAQLSCTNLSSIQLSSVQSDAICVSRKPGNISCTTDAKYMLKVQLEGESLVKYREREAHLRPGDFVLCSSDEPYQLNFPSTYRQAVVVLPFSALEVCLGPVNSLLGQRMAHSAPLHGILSQFVKSVVDCSDSLPAASLMRLETNLIDLLVTSLNSELETKPQYAAEQRLKLVKRFIQMNLQNPGLSPGSIAEAGGISVRYLHMLFKAGGVSVSRYILLRRLKACYLNLKSDGMRTRSVTDIALSWGFNEVSHFNRCFKSYYGVTPKQVRAGNL